MPMCEVADILIRFSLLSFVIVNIFQCPHLPLVLPYWQSGLDGDCPF